MRRLLIVLCAVLVLVVGADFVWWRAAERELNKTFAAEMQVLRNSGWTVSASAPVSGGWPFVASLTIGDLFISGAAVAWSTDRLELEVTMWQPFLLGIETAGMQRLRVGPWQDIPYTADTLRAVVPLQAGVPPRGFRLQMVNLRAGLGETGAEGLTVGALNLQTHWTPAAQEGEAAVSASLHASGVRLPVGVVWPLGPTVENVVADLALNGPLPRAKDLGVKELVERTAAWRDAGGTLQVQRLILDWGALDLTGSATIALDDQLQPMGAGTVHITDPAAALDGLRQNGVLGDKEAFAAKALLALLVKPAGDADKPAVDLPFTLQDRRLSISRYGVARLPRLPLP